MLDALIISMINHPDSIIGARKLSAQFQQQRPSNNIDQHMILPASVPSTAAGDLLKLIMVLQENDIDLNLASLFNEPVDDIVKNLNRPLRQMLRWTWPLDSNQERLDLQTGLYLKPYKAANPEKVMACTISHMRAWVYSIVNNRDVLILEHDAIFDGYFKFKKIYSKNDKFGIVSINSPKGATRNQLGFENGVVQQYRADPSKLLYNVPDVNVAQVDPPLPQGLPGNSAYIIQPWAARKLLEKTIEIGLWPNDALICKEFFPWIKVLYPYVTGLQSIKSTTTG